MRPGLNRCCTWAERPGVGRRPSSNRAHAGGKRCQQRQPRPSVFCHYGSVGGRQGVCLTAAGSWAACSRRITNVELRRLKAAPLLGPAPRRSALRKNRRVACAERECREFKEVNFKNGTGGSRETSTGKPARVEERGRESINFFAELKRRNVYKLAIAYVVVSWLLIQAASIFLPAFDAPPWVMKVFIIVIIFGFPVTLIFSWAFEITPEGIKLESEIEPGKSLKRRTGRKIVAITIALAVVAASLFVFQMVGRDRSARRSNVETAEGGRPPAIAGSLPILEKSIAVLPFDNLSRDPDNAYFCEGVQDEILTRLAKVADFKVISRTSTQHFKSTPSDLREIAKQLGVMHILEGSVQKANDQVRVNVQLINAMNDAHLWAETYDRKLIDIFSVESEIAKTIADTLQAKLTGSEKKMMAAQPTNNTEAYELYHKGKSLWEKRSGDNIPKAIAYYEQAIARDPNYALAYAGLAKAYILLPFYTGADRLGASSKAKEAALKALRLDSNLAEAHGALVKVLFFSEIDLAGAMREYKRAIELA